MCNSQLSTDNNIRTCINNFKNMPISNNNECIGDDTKGAAR